MITNTTKTAKRAGLAAAVVAGAAMFGALAIGDAGDAATEPAPPSQSSTHVAVAQQLPGKMVPLRPPVTQPPERPPITV